MKWLSLLVLFVACSSITYAQSLHSSHKVPIDKKLPDKWKQQLWANERKVYKGKELETIGMPCGGIAAGQLYVRGDGTLANWWIANNGYNTGYGIDWLLDFETPLGPWKVCYQTFEPFGYIDQGFAVTIRQQGKQITRTLSKKDFDDISFIGEYPVARIQYASTSNPIPLEIEGMVYSPFIPLNARESATPATILKYTLKNTSSAPMSVDMTGWLQNLVCADLKDQALGQLRNRVVRQNNLTSVVMDMMAPEKLNIQEARIQVFQNFESGTYGKWKVEGDAFGKTPVLNTVADADFVEGYEGRYLVNSKLSARFGDSSTGKLTSPLFTIQSDYINFSVAGGSYRDRTCINLYVDNKRVRTTVGPNSDKLELAGWNVSEWKGKKAYIELVDAEPGGWGHISVDNIYFSNQPATKKFFPGKHPYFGNVTLSLLGEGAATAAFDGAGQTLDNKATAIKPFGEKLNGAVGATVSLQPGESRELSFVLSWFFPNRPMQYGEGGNWNMPIPTGGPAIGNMYANWFSGSLDVATWLQRNMERLTKETLDFHEAYYQQSTLPYWLTHRIMMPTSTLATETCQWWSTDKFWAWEGVGSCVGTCTHVWNYEQSLSRLFPELERNIREKTDFSTSFQPDGGILARNGWGGILIDGHAGAILKAYREHRMSSNGLFLSRNWDRIKKATLFIINEDGNGDGLIEKEQANTYDIAFYGANTYVGGLYLAGLKAASKMAQHMGDSSFASYCDSIFQNGTRNSVSKLWNGEYFVQDVDLAKHPKFQYGTGCLSDQMFGQTWAHLNQLGYIYPEQHVKTALQSVWKYNWAADVGVQNNTHKPERVYADPGEAGLFIATWPFSQHMGEDGVRYRDEVWTGIEYQVATNMIYEGMIDEALSLMKAVHDRYDGVKHNPWNEIECGDHYARALASWGVLLALQDFRYDGPAGSLAFVPQVQKENFKSFFTTAEGWGNIGQKINNGQQENTIAVAYGNLRLQSVSVKADKKPQSVVLVIDGKTIPQSFKERDDLIEVSFEEVTIVKGQTMSIKLLF